MLFNDSVTTRSCNCTVCCSVTEHKFLYQKWNYPIFRCGVCGLGTTSLVGSFDPQTIYTGDYFQGGRRDGYSSYAGSERVLRREFRRLVLRIREHGPKAGQLLEIGSAYGFFLLEAQQYFKCRGIEISEEASRTCEARGLNVHHGTVNPEFLRTQGPFDVVVMLDVIEHLQDPAKVLLWLYEALNHRGILVISTGDWDSILARVLKRHWRLMTPPQHLFYFSRRTLTRLLERVGFHVVYCVRPWKSVPLGLAAYQLGNRIGLRLSMLESLNWLPVPVNLFDTIQIIARKE